MNLTKLIGSSLILLIILSFLAVFGATLIEIYLKQLDKKMNLELHETEYYGKTLKENPYDDFVIQYLHPYYLFSLPWESDDIKNNNSEIVKIDKYGFRRIVGSNKKNNNKIIFLGGSTAFSHFASDDNNTIGSYLNKLSKYEIVNRNAPSWNSHQELVALLKYHKLNEVIASVSLSLGNDVSLACRGESRYSNEYKDFPESWNLLNKKVDDIRGKVKNESIYKRFKEISRSLFPNLYLKLVQLKQIYLVSKVPNDEVSSYGKCKEENAINVAETFLENQFKMTKIAEGYGFKHFLILQPNLHIHDDALNIGLYGKESGWFREKVINEIMKSQYCNKYPCLDLSTVFENQGYFLEAYESISYQPNLVEKWLDFGIFLDEGHFNDRGNKIVSEKIYDFLISNNFDNL